MTELDPPSAACLERTQSAVLDVLVAVGAGILISGLILGGRDRGALLWSERAEGRALQLVLFILIAASIAVRRVLASHSALKHPSERAARFFRAHLLSAVVGALVIPLGFFYGWAIRPGLDALAPFWVAGLALGVLALPRARELADFDEPMPSLRETSS